MMKIAEVDKKLREFGWSTAKDEVGDRGAKFDLGDRLVSIIFGIDRLTDRQELNAMLSISTEAFSGACSAISWDGYAYSPLIVRRRGIRISAPQIEAEHVRQCSEEAISWARAQDLEQGLKDLAALPTDSCGALPVWHLAALAVRRDVEKLEHYLSCFEAGDRLGFVPYVTQDYIERALALARQNQIQVGS